MAEQLRLACIEPTRRLRRSRRCCTRSCRPAMSTTPMPTRCSASPTLRTAEARRGAVRRPRRRRRLCDAGIRPRAPVRLEFTERNDRVVHQLMPTDRVGSCGTRGARRARANPASHSRRRRRGRRTAPRRASAVGVLVMLSTRRHGVVDIAAGRIASARSTDEPAIGSDAAERSCSAIARRELVELGDRAGDRPDRCETLLRDRARSNRALQ